MNKEETIKSFEINLSPNALEVIKKRYLRCDENGNPTETPAEMFYRVASFMASADKNYDPNCDLDAVTGSFYEILAKLKFLPGGRVLFEAGRTHTGQLASCFVVPIDDSLPGIFDSLKNAAFIQKNNGGTGFNFSKIRPKGDEVKGVSGVAAGPIHYIKTFDAALSSILQGSKRHGGNMGILNVNHPDILEFIRLKDNSGGVKNFNISVGVTDDFMEKVRKDENYDLINPRNGKAAGSLSARAVFEEIIKRAWECADPGVIFLDALERGNKTPGLGRLEATNPCGEQPLLPYESCNLGSIVVENHIKNGEIDWEDLKKTVWTVIHFMDNMIDVNSYPLPIIEENVKKTRKIGMGILGFAHVLYELGIPYDSEKAAKMAGKIMEFVQKEGLSASRELAKKRGAFPALAQSVYSQDKEPPRNATITTIAPNGTISMVANTSSGVEPVFSLVTKRQVFFEESGNSNGGRTLIFVDPVFERVAREEGFYSDELMDRIAKEGTIQHLDEIPNKIKKVFVTAHDISFEWHVKIQAAAQDFTDNAVSKTINFPNSATVDDVKKAYIMSYEMGCKGVTIYRDGSKDSQVLSSGEKVKKEDEASKEEIEAVKAEESKDKKNFDILTCDKVLTPNAVAVLEKRALLKDKNGAIIETPDGLFRRVARVVASAEMLYGKTDEKIKELEENFYQMHKNLEFISGQALRNADDKKLTFSACFVLPVEDSMDSIMQAIKENVLVHKATGGTGFNFSHLRERDSVIGSTGEAVASGPIAFMKAFDVTLDTLRTKGKRKQGAMGILNVDHPDIAEFIKAKDAAGVLTNFNISVGITDEFIKALEKDEEYELISPISKKVVKKEKASQVFNMIVEHAWKTGDPGVIFIDRINEDNPTPSVGKIESTNPCGEQPLLPYESCNLGSVVLSRFVVKDKKDNLDVDWQRLEEVVKLAVRFLDNTIDLNVFPLEKISEVTKKNRKIGLGVMGFADMLIKLGIPYDSEKAVKMAEKVMKFISEKAREASVALGEEKGDFPNFEKSVWPKKGFKNMRNAAVTTIAPTGYTSIVANCSGGIEPIFALAFKRQQSMGGLDQYEANILFESLARSENFYSEELMKKVSAKGSVLGLKEVPEEYQKVFVVAHDINPEWDLKIQAAFQKYVDNAVSKTINFPKSATVEDVARVYRMAYKLGCKGVTIYRDGSKETQVLEVGNIDKNKEVVPAQKLSPQKRPDIISGSTYKVSTSYGNLYVTINNDANGRPFEVFATIGKAGGFFAAKSEAICRLTSLALRSGVDPAEVIDQIKGIRGPMPSWSKKGMILSIPDCIAKVLEEHIKKDQPKLDLEFKHDSNKEVEHGETKIEAPQKNIIAKIKDKIDTKKTSRPIADAGFAPECPECGNVLEFSEGCMVCRSCGYSKCG